MNDPLPRRIDQATLIERPPSRAEIRDRIALRHIIRSNMPPPPKDLALTFWTIKAKCLLEPFECAWGELEKYCWEKRRVKRHIEVVEKHFFNRNRGNGSEVDGGIKEQRTGFEHLLRYQFAETVLPRFAQFEEGSRQLILFEKEGDAPSHFRAPWLIALNWILPKQMLKDKNLPSGTRVPALYYVFDKDWDTKIVTVNFDQFNEVFGSDDRTCREFIATMVKTKYWEEVDSGPRWKAFREIKQVHEPEQAWNLEATLNFNEVAFGFLREFLPLVRAPETSTITTVAILNNAITKQAPGELVSNSSGSAPPNGDKAGELVSNSSASDPANGDKAGKLATNSSAFDGDASYPIPSQRIGWDSIPPAEQIRQLATWLPPALGTTEGMNGWMPYLFGALVVAGKLDDKLFERKVRAARSKDGPPAWLTGAIRAIFRNGGQISERNARDLLASYGIEWTAEMDVDVPPPPTVQPATVPPAPRRSVVDETRKVYGEAKPVNRRSDS